MRSRMMRGIVSGMAGLLACPIPGAHAQNAPDQTGVLHNSAASKKVPQARTKLISPPGESQINLTPPMQQILAEIAKFQKFDTLSYQGYTTDFPGSYETLLGDYGGFRSWLYDHDLAFKANDVAIYNNNLLGDGGPRNPQQFNGQKLSFTNSAEGYLSLRVDGDGVNDIGQFNIGAIWEGSSWNEYLAPGFSIERLDFYQTFFHRLIELQIGYGQNLLEYIGIFAGGNPILANGLAGTIPIEAGLSVAPAEAPLFNILLNGNDGFYVRSGIQRSLGADGYTGNAQHNSSGLRPTYPGAGGIGIAEIGVRRTASTDERQIWLRAGGFYNTTEYTRYDGRGKHTNWIGYALADYQIYKPDKSQPYRGIFVGASALAAPGDVNLYQRSYELRTYAVGMIPSRPEDSLTLTVDYNDFSGNAKAALNELGLPAKPDQLGVGVLYAIHLRRGVFLAPSLNYLHNPSFADTTNKALDFGLALSTLY